jgi:hypothetical protein
MDPTILSAFPQKLIKLQIILDPHEGLVVGSATKYVHVNVNCFSQDVLGRLRFTPGQDIHLRSTEE